MRNRSKFITILLHHGGAFHALTTFMEIASFFGFRVNLGKTKFMLVGVDVSLEDRCSLCVCGGEIEHMFEFRYLGSIISPDCLSHHIIKSYYQIVLSNRIIKSYYQIVLSNRIIKSYYQIMDYFLLMCNQCDTMTSIR